MRRGYSASGRSPPGTGYAVLIISGFLVLAIGFAIAAFVSFGAAKDESKQSSKALYYTGFALALAAAVASLAVPVLFGKQWGRRLAGVSEETK